MAELNSKETEIIQAVLKRWGAWEFSGLDGKRKLNMIAQLMLKAKGVKKLQAREMCSDEAGMLINAVVGFYVKMPCPLDYQYLAARYIYGRSVYAIARWQYGKDQSVTQGQWRRRIIQSLNASEWIVAKMLEQAVKNHKNSAKMQKLVFCA